MSYILDALRRADAERERGGVPGLHTQPTPTESDDDDAGTRARGLRPWHWVVIGLAGGLALGIAMYLGLLRIPLRWFFAVTGALVLLLVRPRRRSRAA